MEEIGRVCSEKTAAIAKEALRGVVIGSNGTARTAFKDCKVEVAGKTGTARVSLPGGGYMDSAGRKKHQGSFVGFFPYEDPKYSVIVVVWSKLANKNFYGGTWGGPVACEIANNIYASSPDWNAPIQAPKQMPQVVTYENHALNDTIIGVPDVIGMGLKEAINTLEPRGYRLEFSGHGKVTEQHPACGALIDMESQKVILKLSEK
ncbi:MAG: PASTA domain-containing protein [Bacteroidales bacterium]|nr:PASTA domain-containing protein [Bacteroidales bacterium]